MQVFSFSPLCMHYISQTALSRQKMLFELVEHYDSSYILTQSDSIWLQLRQPVWFEWVQVQRLVDLQRQEKKHRGYV